MYLSTFRESLKTREVGTETDQTNDKQIEKCQI